MPSDQRVTVVTEIRDPRAPLGRLLAALDAQSFTDHELVVVDSDSRLPGLEAALRGRDRTRSIALGRDAGSSKAFNAAIHASRAPLVALLDAAAAPEPDWLRELVERADSHPNESSWASVELDAADPSRVLGAGVTLLPCGVPARVCGGRTRSELPLAPVEVFGASAAAGLFRRALFVDVGLFDGALVWHREDVDLALRARLAGHASALVPGARVALAAGEQPRRTRNRATYWCCRNDALIAVKSMPLAWLAAHALTIALRGLGALVTRPHRPDGWLCLAAKLALTVNLPVALLKRFRARRTRRVGLREIAPLMTDACAPPP
jgi:GT2 family glycosyltransferase